jgi:tyrosinase
MTYLDYSAFDPVFWLHHTNMDRIFALWQVLHPNKYVEPVKAITQTYTVRIGEIEDVNSRTLPAEIWISLS